VELNPATWKGGHAMSPNTQAHEARSKSRARSRTLTRLAISEPAAESAHTTNGCAVNRKHLRFSLLAQAEVTTLRRGWHLMAEVSQLSARGCYLDTPNPFTTGTEVRLHIRYAGSSCELLGRVIYAHKGWGMGVLFSDAAGQQFDILDEWLAEIEQEQNPNVSLLVKH
jgi:PilZ domain